MDQVTKKRMVFNGPKYIQIHNHLLRQFRDGAYSPNEPLPGERSLAASMNVAVGTLRQALQQLESDGFIHRIPGKGTFVNSPQEQREQVKTNVFSVIVPAIGEEPYPALVEGVEQVASGRYRITVGSSKQDVSQQERLLRQAVKDNVAGVAIVPTASPTPAEHVRLLQEKHIPVVFCHRAVAGVKAPLVCWSFEDVGRMAAETFLRQGHRRITSLMSTRYEAALSYCTGIRCAVLKHGLDKLNFRVHYHGFMPKDNSPETMKGMRDAIREILEQILSDENRPTAIFCGSLFEMDLIYFIANDMGFNIPGDLSLIYFGDNRHRGIMAQRFTCVARNERELGVQAGRLLCEMSSGMKPHDSQDRIEIPLELLPGETVGPPPACG